MAVYLLYKGDEEIGRFLANSVLAHWTEEENHGRKRPVGYLA